MARSGQAADAPPARYTFSWPIDGANLEGKPRNLNKDDQRVITEALKAMGVQPD